MTTHAVQWFIYIKYIYVTGAQQPEVQELFPLQWFGAQEDCRCAASCRWQGSRRRAEEACR